MMTKTQKHILDQIAARGSYTVECGSGRGAKGGRVSYGERERAALFALVDAGLVFISHRESDNDYQSGGNVIRRTSFAARLTDKA
jgi:hypothetical protein